MDNIHSVFRIWIRLDVFVALPWWHTRYKLRAEFTTYIREFILFIY